MKAKFKKAVEWLEWKLAGVSIAIEEQIRDWWPYSVLVAVIYALILTPALVLVLAGRAVLSLSEEGGR